MAQNKRKLRRYGAVWGRPGRLENPDRCVYSVWGQMRDRQCSRKRGHGKDGLYCKQHADKYDLAEQKEDTEL